MHLIRRQTCRVCGSRALKPVIDLGPQHLQGSFVKPGEPNPPMRRVPMQLVRCDTEQDEKACGLLQLAHTVPPPVLYTNYWYRSGVNQTMRDHLRQTAEKASALLGPGRRRVLDIGCNDGTLLRCYPEAYEKFGVDPSDIAATIEPPVQVIPTVFPSALADEVFAGRTFDIVTSIAMFYDLEDPVGFSRAIARSLAPEGVWLFEMSYMPAMLETNSFDTICHEHLEYYSLAAIERILHDAGLHLFRYEMNAINGGSIACYATHVRNLKYHTADASSALAWQRLREFDLQLDTDAPYLAFQQRIEDVRTRLTGLLRDLKADGKRVHIYGASTKGNTLLQWCGIDHTLVDCAADRNPDKHGARTLGTNIPIVDEAQSRAMRPDYYLVLPWHFRDEFLERERETILAGTRMIFPLPEVIIVGPEDLG